MAVLARTTRRRRELDQSARVTDRLVRPLCPLEPVLQAKPYEDTDHSNNLSKAVESSRHTHYSARGRTTTGLTRSRLRPATRLTLGGWQSEGRNKGNKGTVRIAPDCVTGTRRGRFD